MMFLRMILGLMSICFSTGLWAQAGYLEDPLFQYRQPSARAEAMGGAMVAATNGAYTGFYNPAALAGAAAYALNYTYSDPFYVFTDGNYKGLFGIASLGNAGTIGISWYRFQYGVPFVNFALEDGEGESAYSAMMTLSYGRNLGSRLQGGLNVSRYKGWYSSEINASTYLFDIGLTFQAWQKREERRDQRLTLGLALDNLFEGKFSPLDEGQGDPLPVILCFGGSYSSQFLPTNDGRFYNLNATLNAEYQHILNAEKSHFSGVRLGGELLFLDLIAARVGYFSLKLYDYGAADSNALSRWSDFTYGLGIQIPFARIVPNILPIVLSVDFTSRPQTTFSDDFDDWQNLTTLNVGVKVAR